MEKSRLEKLQQVELEILSEVVRVCTENNLQYYLTGGTLLGAIRHKGFIPWDDDIDIAMPRKDYEKFIKCCKSQLDNKYYLHHITTDKNYWLLFAKIRKKNTYVDEFVTRNIKSDYKGISIDIFPLDNAEKQKGILQTCQAMIVKKLRTIILCRSGFDFGFSNRKTFALRLISYGTSIFSTRSLVLFCDNLMKYNKNENSKYYINIASLYHHVKQTILKSSYYPPVKVEFQKEMFNAPNDYKLFLRRIYGKKYMELPPESKRRAPHFVDVTFDTTGKSV